jgi:superfamily II DNA/RNA helicase
LSATIDKTDNFEYYSKDVREMINLKYLCDYTIHIPIFSKDPDNINICKHLLQNYKNIIIYCNTQKEGKIINKLMNELQNNSSQYIDCKTSKNKRNDIINKYKNGKISFLVNVRILVEGFDAPITKGVCFLHLPSSKTMAIQIMGRALRLHPSKIIANIILPFSSKEDEKTICHFLKIMAKNDSRIKKSFENKKFGGYISIDKVNDKVNDDIDDDIEFKYNMIYDNMGVIMNSDDAWQYKFEKLKDYINKNNKRPTLLNNNIEEIRLTCWTSGQMTYYNNNRHNMKIKKYYDIWTDFINDEKYKKYFATCEETWLNVLESLKKYIDINKKRPNCHSKNKEINILGTWISNQTINYNKKIHSMKNKIIYDKWTDFIKNEKYKIYFQSDKDTWNKNFECVKEYINKNDKRPSSENKNEEIKKIGRWITTQMMNYGKKECIMSDDVIYEIWDNFINKSEYNKYFESNEAKWLRMFNATKKYIENNNKRPSSVDKNKEIKQLGVWVCSQIINYNNKTHNMKNIKNMKNNETYNNWHDFINDEKYIKYFKFMNDDT